MNDHRSLSDLTREYYHLRRMKERLEAKVKEINKRMSKIAEIDMVEILQDMEQENGRFKFDLPTSVEMLHFEGGETELTGETAERTAAFMSKQHIWGIMYWPESSVRLTTYTKGQVRHGITSETKPMLLEWLRENGHEDIIKEDVHPSTLTSFLKEELEQLHELPDWFKARQVPVGAVRKS